MMMRLKELLSLFQKRRHPSFLVRRPLPFLPQTTASATAACLRHASEQFVECVVRGISVDLIVEDSRLRQGWSYC